MGFLIKTVGRAATRPLLVYIAATAAGTIVGDAIYDMLVKDGII